MANGNFRRRPHPFVGALPYLVAMHDIAPAPPLAAQDAAEALIALGWPITPHGPDMEFWRIGDLIWTDADVMGLAARHGVQVLTGAGQASTAPLQ